MERERFYELVECAQDRGLVDIALGNADSLLTQQILSIMQTYFDCQASAVLASQFADTYLDYRHFQKLPEPKDPELSEILIEEKRKFREEVTQLAQTLTQRVENEDQCLSAISKMPLTMAFGALV